MGLTKTEQFTLTQNQLAESAKALGHPARVAIIDYLVQQESCICKHIVAELNLSQPTISQHLKVLKNAGLIQGTIEGNTVCYCLDKTAFQRLAAYANKVVQKGCGEKDSC